MTGATGGTGSTGGVVPTPAADPVYTIQFRRGLAAEWATLNPVLPQGSPGVELDTHVFKIGDGVSKWADLPLVGGDAADLQAKLSQLTTGLLHEEPVDSIDSAPPTTPRENAYYIVSAVPPPAGDFVGHDNQIAQWDATKKTWTFTMPEGGETRLVEYENKVYTWNGTKWNALGSVAAGTATHDLKVKTPLDGGDEFALVDAGDAWNPKKVAFVDIEEAVAKYLSDKSMNLDNKGIDLAKNQLHGTIEDFNRALDDGYEFATKDDLAEFLPADEVRALVEQQDNEVMSTVAENMDNLHEVITQEIADAIDAIPGVADQSQQITDLGGRIDSVRQEANAKFDAIAAATADKLTQVKTELTAYSDSYINNVRQTTDAKFDSFAAAVSEKISHLPKEDLNGKIDSVKQDADNKFDSLAAAVDAKIKALPDLNGKIDSVQQDADNKFDALAAAMTAKLAAIPAPDMSEYETKQDASDELDALQDYLVTLLARHASADVNVLAPVKQALDDVFAANTGTSDKDDAPSTKPGRNVKSTPKAPPPPPPKPWIVSPADNTLHYWDGAAFDGGLTIPAAPWAKGSTMISYTVGGGMISFAAAMHDGTDFVPVNIPNCPIGRSTSATFIAWCVDKNAMNTFDPSNYKDSFFVWAEPDGLHLVVVDDGHNPAPEVTAAYPPGVTQADMPASKTF